MTPTLALAVGVPVAVLAGALVLRAIIHGHRDRQRWQALEDQQTFVAYHARRGREIGDALRALGDDAEHVFPDARNGS